MSDRLEEGTLFGHRRSGEILSRCMVSFQGPPMTRRARGSLSAANITVVERRHLTGWDGQLFEYLVSIDASDDGDAVARVRAALEAHGSFARLAPEPMLAD